MTTRPAERWLALLVLLASCVSWADRPRLVVLTLTGSGVDQAQLESMTDRVARALTAREVFEVISAREVQTLLGLERQRALLGCSQTSCLAELSGALGARFVMSGTVVRLGESYQLTLSTLDSQRAQPLGRSVRLGGSLELLLAGVPLAVAEASGLPAPPERSKALPVVLFAVGGAAVVAGGVTGLQALTQEASLQGELQGGALATRESYQRRAEQPAVLRTVALGTLIGGAAALALGAVLWSRASSDGTLALVPTGTGAALVGTFP